MVEDGERRVKANDGYAISSKTGKMLPSPLLARIEHTLCDWRSTHHSCKYRSYQGLNHHVRVPLRHSKVKHDCHEPDFWPLHSSSKIDMNHMCPTIAIPNLRHIWNVHDFVVGGHPASQRGVGFGDAQSPVHAMGKCTPQLATLLPHDWGMNHQPLLTGLFRHYSCFSSANINDCELEVCMTSDQSIVYVKINRDQVWHKTTRRRHARNQEYVISNYHCHYRPLPAMLIMKTEAPHLINHYANMTIAMEPLYSGWTFGCH